MSNDRWLNNKFNGARSQATCPFYLRGNIGTGDTEACASRILQV